MITLGDRVSRIVDRDPRLIDVFVSVSPVFERLRNPAMRRVMGGLVTVEQAARVAGVDPAALLDRLNSPASERPIGPLEPGPSGSQLPAHLERIPADRIVAVDVRAELRAGSEPFARIMEARRAMTAGDVLSVRAIFEPAPLYAVMAKQGLEHWTERIADDDWRVWFFEAKAGATTSGPSDAGDTSGYRFVLDVRGLEPPEPMVRTVVAAQELEAGESLLQVNTRTPEFLLPQLAERGFTWDVRQVAPDLVHVIVRRPATPPDAA